ncbi:hypothetical protein F4778DRAFT_758138 [Xylariomycetidae sp. FL2044]|nr:hypothetical protein F4778DRAFT_758138 [Xylariomycetidae sp. FL2044]
MRNPKMGFDGLAKLVKAGESAQGYLVKKWEERQNRVRLDAARQRKETLLSLVAGKLTGPSAADMPPLIFDLDASHRAVFLVTVPIVYGGFDVSTKSYKLLAKHVGMSLDSVSHWALCVVDRGFGPCWCYDLMSDQLALSMLGKSYLRVYEATPEFIASWHSCVYMGESTKSHEEIQSLAHEHLAAHPRYNLLSSNCQHLVEILVQELCNGRRISQAKLEEELHLASPRMARDLLVARLRSRVDAKVEHEGSQDFAEDVMTINQLHRRATGDYGH